ncbi:four helix bundle protein [Candidatus Roizmanbacteria bacterium]|nr:four helix bundle protein [Candidatus Roizmanbacteria bacterium]
MINDKTKHKFDLEERTARFGENVLIFCKNIRLNSINESLIKQLIRSSTSVGANYMEANGSDSRKDFKNKISICKKESKETTHWLRMLSVVLPEYKEKLRNLWKKAQEFVLIFSSIVKKV